MGSSVVVRPSKEMIDRLGSCLRVLYGVLLETLGDPVFRGRYGGVVERVLGVVYGGVDVWFVVVSGLLCCRLEDGGVYVYPVVYLGQGLGGVEEHVIVLSRHLLDVDEKVFCRNMLHELVHVAGFDEDVAGELTDVLSERFPEVFGLGGDAVKVVDDIVERKGLTCMFIEEAVEKNPETIDKLGRYAISLRDLVKCGN